ncbi:hypothetical protein BIFGAL_02887 [Bifidobacterium gallicum DSM 20093 = LMG 11596]|uniref:Uncharacterized protein n=1 Tax=Bifidobacterium gallicum DSM 20093 = LMG 11596 TaxID=561180 RepID=D1NSX6_9BIFI|nr:hypothetical protein BIFGAL_02887 [Bifidobacterium gallicum DSM 20093 = LMG 11596]
MHFWLESVSPLCHRGTNTLHIRFPTPNLYCFCTTVVQKRYIRIHLVASPDPK